jgi:hypothetical protein
MERSVPLLAKRLIGPAFWLFVFSRPGLRKVVQPPARVLLFLAAGGHWLWPFSQPVFWSDLGESRRHLHTPSTRNTKEASGSAHGKSPFQRISEMPMRPSTVGRGRGRCRRYNISKADAPGNRLAGSSISKVDVIGMADETEKNY